MDRIVDRLLARLRTRSARMIDVLIPIAVDGEEFVGGARIRPATREQRADRGA